MVIIVTFHNIMVKFFDETDQILTAMIFDLFFQKFPNSNIGTEVRHSSPQYCIMG